MDASFDYRRVGERPPVVGGTEKQYLRTARSGELAVRSESDKKGPAAARDGA